jgi:trehalose 6-phosphate phosphatase
MTDSPPLPHVSDRWAFFLDIDGTLVEFAPRPDAVRIDPATVQLVDRLHAGTGGAVALVSGRPIVTIDDLFAPLRLPVAGQHGVERRDARGHLHVHSPAPEALRRAAAALAAATARHTGLVFEDKVLSLTLHYRLAPQLESYVRETVAAVAAELGDGYELLNGKMMIEVKPAGRSKGAAIGDFLREAPFERRLPVFIGDDTTDEFGFGAVNRMGGHSVKVGAGETAARWRLADPQAVRAWLARSAAALRIGASARAQSRGEAV